MIDDTKPPFEASHADPGKRVGIRRPRIMRENKTNGSKTIEGGILVYPRKDYPGRWLVMWRTQEGRRYRGFSSLTAANFFASELQRQRRAGVVKSEHSVLSSSEMSFLQELRDATKGAKLSELVIAWKEYQARNAGMTMGEVVQRFMDLRAKEGVVRSIQTSSALYVSRFVRKYGAKRAANSFTPNEVREWVFGLQRAGYSPKTVKHHLRTLSMVFHRAIAEGWASKNPCLAVTPPKIEKKEVTVLSLADAQRLFEANTGHRVCIYMALEAFGGLRCSSAVRVSKDDINAVDRSIVLPAAKHKTGRRHLLEGLPDNLWEWLRHAGVLADKRWTDRPWAMSMPLYNKEKRAAFERAGLKLQGNVLRHSFCSYHVAWHQDAAKTAILMQHTNQSMIYRHYKGVATRADAEGYFAITPSPDAPPAVHRPCGRPRRVEPQVSKPPDEGVSANPA